MHWVNCRIMTIKNSSSFEYCSKYGKVIKIEVLCERLCAYSQKPIDKLDKLAIL